MWCIMGTAASRGSTQHITAQWLNTTAKKSGHLFGILRFTSWSAGNSEMESRTRGVSIRAIQSKVMEDDDGQYWINEILYVSPYSCHWVTFHMYFMKYCLWVLNFVRHTISRTVTLELVFEYFLNIYGAPCPECCVYLVMSHDVYAMF